MVRWWVNKRFEFSADKQWLSGTRSTEQLCCLQLNRARDATVILTFFWRGTWFKKHEKHWFKSRAHPSCHVGKWCVFYVHLSLESKGHGTCLIHDKINVPKLKHRQLCKSCAWLKIFCRGLITGVCTNSTSNSLYSSSHQWGNVTSFGRTEWAASNFFKVQRGGSQCQRCQRAQWGDDEPWQG